MKWFVILLLVIHAGALDERITRYTPKNVISVFDHADMGPEFNAQPYDGDPEVHMFASIFKDQLLTTFKSNQGARNFYSMIQPQVYDEIMRQINYIEPYFLANFIV